MNCILLHLTWDVNKHYKTLFFSIQFVHPFTENTNEKKILLLFCQIHMLEETEWISQIVPAESSSFMYWWEPQKGTIDRVHSSICSPECLEFCWSSLLVDPVLQVWSPWVISWVQRSPSYSPVCFSCSGDEAMHVQRSLKCKMTKHFKLPDVSLRVKDF